MAKNYIPPQSVLDALHDVVQLLHKSIRIVIINGIETYVDLDTSASRLFGDDWTTIELILVVDGDDLSMKYDMPDTDLKPEAARGIAEAIQSHFLAHLLVASQSLVTP